MKAATVASMEICENPNLVPNPPIVKRKPKIVIPLKGGLLLQEGKQNGNTAATDYASGVAGVSKVETESDHNFNAIMHNNKDEEDFSVEESLIKIDMD